ncbi:hypothetical protein ADU37_CDS21200 [Thermococcus sp. 2319x1]|nr:hypothetical protein ADU37_CDS21200 [Thermococcus sp. 2319x1]
MKSGKISKLSLTVLFKKDLKKEPEVVKERSTVRCIFTSAHFTFPKEGD